MFQSATSFRVALAVLCLGLATTGCLTDQEEAIIEPATAPSVETAVPAAPSTSETMPAATSSADAPATGSPTTPPSAAAPRVELSAGVALLPTLREGTTVGVSIDYAFAVGEPDASAEYVWVIESAAGPPVEVAAEVGRQGTFQNFIPALSPDGGPFQAQLIEVAADGTRRAVSEKIPLR